MRTLGWLTMPALVLALAGTAAAQTEEEGSVSGGGDDLGAPSDEQASGESASEEPAQPYGDDEAPAEEYGEDEVAVDDMSPVELENTDYYFLGLMGRGVIIPGFIQQLFVDGGIDAVNGGVGASFNWRRNNFNLVANVWWNGAEGQGFFRAVGDPRTDTEFVDVHLGVIFINAEFLWAFPITDWFAFEIGFDLGFGFIYGDLYRTEASESSTGAGDWQPCAGVGSPNPVYCEAVGGHYNFREGNWLEGGDTPFVFPWVTLPHLAVRFKPIRQVQIRIDGGYGLYNFFFGGTVSYGF